MTELTAPIGRTQWRLPHYVAVVTVTICVLIALAPRDLFLLVSIFVIAPALLLLSAQLISQTARADAEGRRRHWKSSLATFLIIWIIPLFLFFHERNHPFEFRSVVRWIVYSNQYKREVLAQPVSDPNGFRHIEWDGTGFAGIANNTEFLVFDPQDSLSIAAQSEEPIKVAGIPCEVRQMLRLERNWYAVLFYTDQYWGTQGNCE